MQKVRGIVDVEYLQNDFDKDDDNDDDNEDEDEKDDYSTTSVNFQAIQLYFWIIYSQINIGLLLISHFFDKKTFFHADICLDRF